MFRCKGPPLARVLDMIKGYPGGVLSLSKEELIFQAHQSDDQVLVHLSFHWSSFENFKCKEDLTHAISPQVFYSLLQYSTIRITLVESTIQIKGSKEDESFEWTIPVDTKTDTTAVILDVEKPNTADLFIETTRLQKLSKVT